jgi:filamentous hemagglutinin family protein
MIGARRVAVNLALSVFSVTCFAGIATDGSLGPAETLSGPDYAISGKLGKRVGSNLFHSFRLFDIASGESATFSGSASVRNIVSRVTGGSSSTIDGAINSTIQGANLYLLNPNGIFFGENASLNISGSFHASTASYLVLGDGGRFDVATPANSVLTSAPPQAFGFLGDRQAAVSLKQAVVEVPEGETLSLTGGNLTVRDGLLSAPGGRVQLVSVASAGEVPVDASRLAHDRFEQMGDVRITGEREPGGIDASGDSGGEVIIRSGRFYLNNALVYADSYVGDGGAVDIEVTDAARLSNDALISADAQGSGSGSSLNLNTGKLVLTTGARLQMDNYGSGEAGEMGVVADSVRINGQTSGIFAASFGAGAGGAIQVRSGSLSIADGGRVESLADAEGNAGRLSIQAATVSVDDGGMINSETWARGDAADIVLEVKDLQVTGGGAVSSESLGQGSAGNIAVTATGIAGISGVGRGRASGVFSNALSSGDGGRVRINAETIVLTDQGKIQAAVADGGSGLKAANSATRAGSITLQAGSLKVSGQAQISTQSNTAARAGDIQVEVAGPLQVTSPAGPRQSGIFSTASATGAGGDIVVTAQTLAMQGGQINSSSARSGDAGSVSMQLGAVHLQQGAQISTSTAGSGDGGVLRLQVRGDVKMDGRAKDGFRSGLYSIARDSGRGGDVDLTGSQVQLRDGGQITARSSGSGDAGNVLVKTDSLDIEQAGLSTQAVDSDGGNVRVEAIDRVYLDNSEITASVGGGSGNGGNVYIDPEFVVLDQSRILANAFGGRGGNILIVTDYFIASSDSSIDASSRLGVDGRVAIRSSVGELDSNLIALPDTYLEKAGLLREPCSARHYADRSSFTVAGRSGLATIPGSSMSLLSTIAEALPTQNNQHNAVAKVAMIQGQSGWLAHALAARKFGCVP